MLIILKGTQKKNTKKVDNDISIKQERKENIDDLKRDA